MLKLIATRSRIANRIVAFLRIENCFFYFQALTALVAAAVADIGITSGTAPGFNYKVPHTSYGVPSHQHGSSSYKTGYSSYSGAGNLGSANLGNAGGVKGFSNNYYKGYSGLNAFPSAGGNYQTIQSSSSQHSSGPVGGAHYDYQSGSQYNNGNAYQTQNLGSLGQYSSGLNTPTYQYSAAPVPLSTVQYQYGNQYQNKYQSSIQQQYQEYYRQQQQQPAQVFKHFYLHSAPEEPEEPKYRQVPVLPPPQKHYKIIFIKTPSQQAAAPQLVPVQQQNEEKTIVYVLVQKPEEGGEIVVPKVEQKPPAKPEVFFIKYNSKEGSENVINNIVNDYNTKNQAGSVSYSGVETPAHSSSSDASYSLHGGNSHPIATPLSGQAVEQNSQTIFTASTPLPVNLINTSDNQNYASAEASTLGGFQNDAEASAIAQSGFSKDQTQNFGTVNTLSTIQGVPHETYGIPKFMEN